MIYRQDSWLEQWVNSKRGGAPLNFDADTKRRAIELASKLKKVFHGCEIYWRRSSSGRGFHFAIALDGKPVYVPKALALALRHYCGDCYGRLKVDSIRLRQGRQISILFSWKNGFKAGAWRKLDRIKAIKEVTCS